MGCLRLDEEYKGIKIIMSDKNKANEKNIDYDSIKEILEETLEEKLKK